MLMSRKPNYCKGVAIVHGKSELLLVEHIKSNLHLPIEIYAENNGKTSIQIDGLMKILGNNIFKNRNSFNRKYEVETEDGMYKNFCIMPIMDLDDTDETSAEKYISKEMFSEHWLNPYIVPIWNRNNLDEVLLDLGMIDKMPNNKEKGKKYRDIFPTNRQETDIEQVKKIMRSFEMSNKTNMDEFIKICLKSM